MEKILISACLVGDKTKYDGKSNYNPLIKDLLEKYELIPFCPEVEGGLSIPRKPSERKGDKVINSIGKDVTKQFALGAEKAYNICMYLGITTVILKEYSPSCGVNQIYDGTFSHKLIDGQGYTAEYLSSKGIKVLSENDISSLL
ncbi:MAG: DUF523 domain-containing protein [Erysipelotrichaceae bacterium]|nr:DUF523 domain-containing protein [Erysipelotrichaceae bacterium]